MKDIKGAFHREEYYRDFLVGNFQLKSKAIKNYLEYDREVAHFIIWYSTSLKYSRFYFTEGMAEYIDDVEIFLRKNIKPDLFPEPVIGITMKYKTFINSVLNTQEFNNRSKLITIMEGYLTKAQIRDICYTVLYDNYILGKKEMYLFKDILPDNFFDSLNRESVAKLKKGYNLARIPTFIKCAVNFTDDIQEQRELYEAYLRSYLEFTYDTTEDDFIELDIRALCGRYGLAYSRFGMAYYKFHVKLIELSNLSGKSQVNILYSDLLLSFDNMTKLENKLGEELKPVTYEFSY